MLDLEYQVVTFIMFIVPIYVLAFLLYVVRVLKGPTISDTVLALDSLLYDVAAFTAILALFFKSPILAPISIIIALWAYATDIYVAKYLESREMGD